jgi:hypothetical protein
MQPIYFQGLKKKPTFDEIVGYLENDQQFMAHPDRTYTRLKNDQYYSNLNMAGVNSINAQSDNLLKEQAMQLNRTQQMQTLGLSQPQVTAANIARGSGAPIGQQFDMSTPPRPPFLPPRSSGRGSGATSGWASVVDPLDVDPFDRDVLMDKLEEVKKKEEADAEAKMQRMTQQVADDALADDVAGDVADDLVGRIFGTLQRSSSTTSQLEEGKRGRSSSIASQLEEVKRGRTAEYRSGSPVARNRGNSPFQDKPRSSSVGARVRTLADLKGDSSQSASGSQDIPRPPSVELLRGQVGGGSSSTGTTTGLEPVHEGKIDFTQETKMIGTKTVDLGEPGSYWNNKLSVKSIELQYKMRTGLTYVKQNKIYNIAELINYDRSAGGKKGKAIVRAVGDGFKIQIEYEEAKKGK